MNSALLIPCRNAAHYLPRLWETVRAQTLPFDEIICFDDASTDNTAEVARCLGATVLCGKSKVGVAAARNQLWRATKMEWVHFHDADDLLAPTYHAKVSARAGSSTDVVICNALWLRETSREFEMAWSYSESELLRSPVSYLLNHPVGGINGFYRRSVLEQIGGFDERLEIWEDADLHLRIALNQSRFAVVEEALVIALRNATSLSTDLQRSWRNRLLALRHYSNLLPSGFRPELLLEIENAARVLLSIKDVDSAQEAIALAQSLGGNPPTSRSNLVRLCRRLFGPLLALRLQAAFRRT